MEKQQLLSFMEQYKRVNSEIIVNGEPCWEWTRGCHNNGYGITYVDKKQFIVSRLSAWIFWDFDYVNSKKLITHDCDNPKCWNPKHLKEGDHKSNMKECIERLGWKVYKSYRCIRGHEFTPDNTYVSKGKRKCKACAKIRKGKT
jgi:hypothetical protein